MKIKSGNYFLFFLLLLAASACQPQATGLQTAHKDGMAFRYDPRAFENCVAETKSRLTSQENGTDIPLAVYPAHVIFHLSDRRPLPALAKGPRYFNPVSSSVAVIPLQDNTVPDFDAAYPLLSQEVKKLELLLAQRPAIPNPQALPDLSTVNQAHAMVSKFQYMDLPAVNGILFLTQYTQEASGNPVNNEELACVFQGLTLDKKHYVAAQFAITHPALPAGIDVAQAIVRDPQELYLKNAEQALNGYSDDSFQPALPAIKAVLSSLRIHPK